MKSAGYPRSIYLKRRKCPVRACTAAEGFEERLAFSKTDGENAVPGTKYTDKQERKAEHIEDSYKEKGVPAKEAEARAWATVNKQDGGGKNPGGSDRKGASKKKEK